MLYLISSSAIEHVGISSKGVIFGGTIMTGGGFGGCIVALADPDAKIDGLIVEASSGARLLE